MEIKERTVCEIKLTDEDKKLFGDTYDLAWKIQHLVFARYYDDWDGKHEKLIEGCDTIMRALAEFSTNFGDDWEFANWGRTVENKGE